MQVEGKDADRMIRLLALAEKENMRYVTMEKNNITGAVMPETLTLHKDRGQANYAAFLAGAVLGKNMEVLPVKALLQEMLRYTLSQQLRMQNWTEHTTLFVDTGRLRMNEITRQDREVSEIARKLKDQQIQPDVKQLREYISRDRQQFTISGIGKEKGYDVNIQQDDKRSFHIAGIIPQQEHERHKSMKMMQQEELLGGRLHREDAPGVKQMMQAQREAGNRFVAFENGQERITGKHFTGFQNALQAVEFVHQKARQNESYLFRSISLIEREADKVLEDKKERSPVTEKAAETKRSRGTELLR